MLLSLVFETKDISLIKPSGQHVNFAVGGILLEVAVMFTVYISVNANLSKFRNNLNFIVIIEESRFA